MRVGLLFAVIVSLFVVVDVRGLRVFFLSDCNLFVCQPACSWGSNAFPLIGLWQFAVSEYVACGF